MRCLLLSLLVLLSNHLLIAQDYENVATLLGINHTFDDNGTFGGGTSFVDFNNDGWDDISFASALGDSLYFYKNNGGVDFTRVYFTGLESMCQSKQITWIDIENDGDKDFFVSCHPQANHLFENLGNMNFQDITITGGLDSIAEYTFGNSWGDIDRDGDMDLVIFNRSSVDQRNIILYRNNGNRTFTDITRHAEVDSIPHGPFCGTFIDYNKDGWSDLYIAQDKYFGNNLFENNWNNIFTDASISSGLGHALDAMCVAPGDIDNDDDIDIFVTNTPLEGNHLFTNNGSGFFTETAAAAGVVVNGFDWGANFFDVENDGDLDLYVSGTYTMNDDANSHLFINNGLGSFSVSNPIMPNDEFQSYSNAVGDFNQDGFPDIAVNNYIGTLSSLWKNLNGENKTGGNWVKIKLQGVQSNIDGYGTKLEIYSNGNKQLRYTYCGEGFIAQNATHEIFGLGNDTAVDSLVVSWTSGNIDMIYDLAINQEHLIVEGAVATAIKDETLMVDHFQADLTGHLQFSVLQKEVTSFEVDVLMIDGRSMMHRTISNTNPGQLHQLNMSNTPPGVYIFSISSDGKVWSQSFIIQ